MSFISFLEKFREISTKFHEEKHFQKNFSPQNSRCSLKELKWNIYGPGTKRLHYRDNLNKYSLFKKSHLTSI